MMQQLREIYRYRDMLKYLVRTDLRARYRGSILGFLWTFVNPLMLIVIYTIVFSTILKVNIPNYTVYLLAGLLPWNLFQSTLIGSSSVILRNSNLVKKIYFPREVLPVSVVIANTINYLYSMVIVVLAILVSGSHLSWSIFLFPFILIIEVLMTTGFALLFSSLNVFFRDVEHILTVFMTAWFYVTPVLYTLTIIPESLRNLFYLNPMTSIIEAYVDVLYRGQVPSATIIGLGLTWAIGIFVLGWIVFSRLQKGFGEEV